MADSSGHLPQAPPKEKGWRTWSGRKKAVVVGSAAFLALLVMGGLAGPRQPPGAAGPTSLVVASPTIGAAVSTQPPSPAASAVLVPTQPATDDHPPGYVSATEYGARWPLTVPDGVLSCLPPGSVLFEAPEGQRYPVNGLAQSRFPDLPEIEGIWAFNPDPLMADAGVRINIGPLIDRGLELCD